MYNRKPSENQKYSFPVVNGVVINCLVSHDPNCYLLLLSIDITPEDDVRDLFPAEASSLGTLTLLRKELAGSAAIFDESTTIFVETSESR